MTGFEHLLTLQTNDIRIDQLRHKLAHLPERAAIINWEKRREAHASALAAAHLEREQLGREAKRYEDEAAIVEAKADEADAKLYSGSVTNAKELQALQDDVASLRRRQAELEELELGFMVQCEPVDATLTRLTALGDELEAEGQQLTVALAEADSEMAAELAAVEAARAESVHHVDGHLLAEYDRLRPVMDGIAVAKLRGSVCEGCHLSLSAMAIDKIRHTAPDDVVHCDECGRILVRTSA